MPSPDGVPEELAPLLRRNALEVTDARFHFDADRLIEALQRVLAKAAEERQLPLPGSPGGVPVSAPDVGRDAASPGSAERASPRVSVRHAVENAPRSSRRRLGVTVLLVAIGGLLALSAALPRSPSAAAVAVSPADSARAEPSRAAPLPPPAPVAPAPLMAPRLPPPPSDVPAVAATAPRTAVSIPKELPAPPQRAARKASPTAPNQEWHDVFERSSAPPRAEPGSEQKRDPRASAKWSSAFE
jgi:hypothetical protein